MKSRNLFILCTALIGFSLIWACDDDESSDADTAMVDTTVGDTSTPDTSAPDSSAPDATATDTAADTGGDATTPSDVAPDSTGGDTASDMASDMVVVTPEERGQYLVDHVGVCGDCHTPRDMMGQPIAGMYLAGNDPFVDIDPSDDMLGAVPSPNLTPHATGLESWTDDEIKAAIRDGVDKDGNGLFAMMPYFTYHHFTDADADAIVAYLRSIPAVDNTISDRQDLGFPVNAALPLPDADIPHTTLAAGDANYDAAVQGRYLATVAACIECHTEPAMAAVPLDTTKLFGGGRAYPAAEFGLPVPPFPDVIYTKNLTQDADGLQGWTAQQFQTALKQGTDINAEGICPPMPAGPMGAYGGLTDEDALAIGHYLTTIPPVAHGPFPNDCSIP